MSEREGREEREPRYYDLRHPAPHRDAGRGAGRRRAVLAARGLFGVASAAILLASGLTWAAYRDLTGGMSTSVALHVVKPGERGSVPKICVQINVRTGSR